MTFPDVAYITFFICIRTSPSRFSKSYKIIYTLVMVAKNIVSKIGEWGDVWLYSLLIDGLDVRGDSHGGKEQW
jgi:hypothetical protein|uniref:AT4g24411 n=1 Tax=Arabidopsis thaliana TaxID=3702 RepID=Q94EX1_ARATH|nr:AT4g24411 [Arabidopsis thaliana]BAE98682.1 hypothetical protein [Arabidopsis thaliana]